MRAGMAFEELAGWANTQPCGRSDGPAASRAACKNALLKAERLYHRRLIVHGETMRCKERGFENKNLRWQLDRRNGIVVQSARERRGRKSALESWSAALTFPLEVLKEENKDLRERAVLAEVRIDELKEDLDRARGTR